MSNLAHPSTLTAAQAVAYARDLHSRPQDWHEGDLEERIWEFQSYTLTDLPIDRVCLDEWMVDDDEVETFVARILAGSPLPPILFDPEQDSIIDGIHRANAAARLGINTIRAYVGRRVSN